MSEREDIERIYDNIGGSLESYHRGKQAGLDEAIDLLPRLIEEKLADAANSVDEKVSLAQRKARTAKIHYCSAYRMWLSFTVLAFLLALGIAVTAGLYVIGVMGAPWGLIGFIVGTAFSAIAAWLMSIPLMQARVKLEDTKQDHAEALQRKLDVDFASHEIRQEMKLL